MFQARHFFEPLFGGRHPLFRPRIRPIIRIPIVLFAPIRQVGLFDSHDFPDPARILSLARSIGAGQSFLTEGPQVLQVLELRFQFLLAIPRCALNHLFQFSDLTVQHVYLLGPVGRISNFQKLIVGISPLIQAFSLRNEPFPLPHQIIDFLLQILCLLASGLGSRQLGLQVVYFLINGINLRLQMLITIFIEIEHFPPHLRQDSIHIDIGRIPKRSGPGPGHGVVDHRYCVQTLGLHRRRAVSRRVRGKLHLDPTCGHTAHSQNHGTKH